MVVASVATDGVDQQTCSCSRYYRAPELIFGATNYTNSIDVWSAGTVMAELLLGQPIFPGDSGVDQLVEIIKVLGTPTREQIQSMNPNYKEFKFPQIKAHPWNKVFRVHTPTEAIDLISKIIEYTPTSRPTPQAACQHAFFDELAGNTLIDVIPSVSDTRPIHLISGDIGPFEAGVPCKVPIWTAILMKRKHNCHIVMPKWMELEELKKLLASEAENDGLAELPDHFFEICHMLVREKEYFRGKMAERVDDIWDRMKTIAQEGSLLMLDGVVQKSHNFLEYDERMLKRAAERYRGTISLDKVEYSLSPVAGGSSVQGTNGDLMVIFVKQQTISGLLLINWKGYVPSHIETLLIEAISGR